MSRTYTIQITKNGTNYSNTQSYATQGTTLFGITAGSMSLEKILCDGQFELGQCNSAKFEAQIFKLSEDITNATIKVYQTITTNNVPVTTQIFEGKIESSNKDRTNYFRDIVAYDMLYFVRDVDISAGWNGTSIWTDTTTSITLKTLTQRLCSLVGISYQYPTSLVNDNLLFAPQFVELSSATFGTMLKMICELQGCFPVMINSTLNFVTINTSATATNITNLYDATNTEFEDYNIDAIDCINVYSTSSDLIQSVYVNTHANAYAVAGNVFVLSMSTTDITTALTKVLNLISPIVYNPAKIKMIIGDTSYALGKKLKTVRNNTNYTHYIFKETFSDSLFVDHEIECQSAGKTRDSSVSQVNNQLISDQKMTEIRQDMDGIIIIAESKNKTYRQTAVPSVGISAGDLWYTTGTPTSPYVSGKWYRYNGTSWQLSEDSTIAEHTATLETQAQQISAKVSQTGGSAQSFAWSLTSSGFTLTSNNNVVMSVTSSGIAISGTASIGNNTTINDVKNTANTASSTATSAYTLAGDAKDVADDAKGTAESASSVANTAQQTANSKNKTFAQASAPTSDMRDGDLWVDTDDNNTLYRYTNNAWVSIRDALIQIAYNLAGSKTTTWYDANEPSNAKVGDIWYDITNNKIKRLTAVSPSKTWSDITNNALYDALSAAQGAQETADGKIVTFAQTSEPQTGSLGDLWIDTDDNNKLYRHNGTSWVEYRDGGIVQAINDSSSAVQTANTAYSSRVIATQKVYYLQFVNSQGQYIKPSAPTTWVTNSGTGAGAWTTSIPTPMKYYHYFSCTQIKFANNAISNTQVVEEDARNIEIEWCSNIDMVYIDGGKLYANSVTASQIAAGTITANEINTASIQAAVVTAEKVNALDITAKNIEIVNTSGDVLFSAITSKTSGGQTITNQVTLAGFTVKKLAAGFTGPTTFLSTGPSYVGDLGIAGAYIGSDGITFTNGLNPSTVTQDKYITIQLASGYIHAEHYEVGDKFLPKTNAYMDTMETWRGQDVGSTSKVFRTVYCKSTSTGSSRNIKKDIVEIPEVYDTLFDNLIPRKYMYNGLNCDRQHIGFIVDEVGSAISSAGLTSLDYGAYQLYNIDDPNGMGGLNYLEFIALNTWQIQKLKARVAELEERLNNGQTVNT